MLNSLALLLVVPGSPAPSLPVESNVVPEPVVPVESLALPEPAPLARALFLPQDEEADEGWTGNVDLGATLSSGNSDIITASAQVRAQKEWDVNRLTYKGQWTFAEQKDTNGNNQVTQRNWTTGLKYDRFFDEKTYGYAAVRLDNDDIGSLHLRQTYSAGLGHKFADKEEYKFDGEAGVAYVDENYFSSNTGMNQDDDEYVALRVAYDLFYQINENWQFLQTVELFPSVSFSEFNGIKDSRLKTDLTENMYFQLQWIARYNNNAPTGATSTDSLWLVSLGWTF